MSLLSDDYHKMKPLLKVMIGLSTCRLANDERTALAKACPYFPDTYLDFLASIRLDPKKQVEMTFHPTSDGKDMGEIQCVIRGLWKEVILYEVPVMSICAYLIPRSGLLTFTDEQ